MSIFYLSFLNIYDFNIAYHRITTENDNNRTRFSTMTAMTTIAFVYGSTFRRKIRREAFVQSVLGDYRETYQCPVYIRGSELSKRYPAKPIDGRSTPGLFQKKERHWLLN